MAQCSLSCDCCQRVFSEERGIQPCLLITCQHNLCSNCASEAVHQKRCPLCNRIFNRYRVNTVAVELLRELEKKTKSSRNDKITREIERRTWLEEKETLEREREVWKREKGAWEAERAQLLRQLSSQSSREAANCHSSVPLEKLTEQAQESMKIIYELNEVITKANGNNGENLQTIASMDTSDLHHLNSAEIATVVEKRVGEMMIMFNGVRVLADATMEFAKPYVKESDPIIVKQIVEEDDNEKGL